MAYHLIWLVPATPLRTKAIRIHQKTVGVPMPTSKKLPVVSLARREGRHLHDEHRGVNRLRRSQGEEHPAARGVAEVAPEHVAGAVG